jgi:hypothetical protein
VASLGKLVRPDLNKTAWWCTTIILAKQVGLGKIKTLLEK